jgi:hypothetical protein
MRSFYIALLFLLFSHGDSFSQTILISGKVRSDLDLAVPGVTVSIKDTKMATATDGEGQFAIVVQKIPVSLIFSAIGYKQQELLLTKKDSAGYIPSAFLR